jgi:hypothetical protein
MVSEHFEALQALAAATVVQRKRRVKIATFRNGQKKAPFAVRRGAVAPG